MKTNLNWAKAVATVGGAGLLPVAPGTWGAAVGAVVLLPFLGKNGLDIFPILLAATAALTWFGAAVARKLEPEWGDDPKPFVLDELVGMWVSLLGHTLTGTNLLLGFLLFRMFDIWKPLGIRRLENVPRGWGVMLDDVGAGLLANALLWLV
ncbi:MAG: phosphatidylglycerophosphatase A [Saprospiraceae bacterium]